MDMSQKVLICDESLQIESNRDLVTKAKIIAIRSTLMVGLWLRS